MADENLTLRQSIEKAATDQQTQTNPEAEEKSESNSDVETKDETNEETKAEPVDQLHDELEEALAFYRAIKDPNQQTTIIHELAQRAGLLTSKQEKAGELTPSENKKFSEMLSDILTEEYPDLKDKLGKVFEAYDREQNVKFESLVKTISAEKAERMVTEFESEFSSFIKANNVTEETAAKMNHEIAELPPPTGQNGKKISLTQYLTKIHRLVTGEQKKVQDDIKRVEKINNNLKERSMNLSSDVGEDRLRKGSQLPSLKESIAAAARGIKFDE